jgi:hypothetical protein
MRALVPVVALTALLAGCSGAAGAADDDDPGIAARTAIAPEERSTCEALGRVDLGVVATDPASLDRAADRLDVTGLRAPADVRPVLGSLAEAYRAAAEAPETASQLPATQASTDIVGWYNAHCGGAR